jgi:cell division protein FtsB
VRVSGRKQEPTALLRLRNLAVPKRSAAVVAAAERAVDNVDNVDNAVDVDSIDNGDVNIDHVDVNIDKVAGTIDDLENADNVDNLDNVDKVDSVDKLNRGRKPDKKPHPHRRRRILLAVWTTAVVVAAGLVLLLVLPTRAWLSQRSAIASAERRLEVLQAENAKLQARVAALQTPAAVEQVGREQYSLAEPGEKVYSVLPAPTLTNLPSGWPYSLVGQIMAVRTATPPAGSG